MPQTIRFPDGSTKTYPDLPPDQLAAAIERDLELRQPPPEREEPGFFGRVANTFKSGAQMSYDALRNMTMTDALEGANVAASFIPQTRFGAGLVEGLGAGTKALMAATPRIAATVGTGMAASANEGNNPTNRGIFEALLEGVSAYGGRMLPRLGNRAAMLSGETRDRRLIDRVVDSLDRINARRGPFQRRMPVGAPLKVDKALNKTGSEIRQLIEEADAQHKSVRMLDYADKSKPDLKEMTEGAEMPRSARLNTLRNERQHITETLADLRGQSVGALNQQIAEIARQQGVTRRQVLRDMMSSHYIPISRAQEMQKTAGETGSDIIAARERGEYVPPSTRRKGVRASQRSDVMKRLQEEQVEGLADTRLRYSDLKTVERGNAALPGHGTLIGSPGRASVRGGLGAALGRAGFGAGGAMLGNAAMGGDAMWPMVLAGLLAAGASPHNISTFFSILGRAANVTPAAVRLTREADRRAQQRKPGDR